LPANALLKDISTVKTDNMKSKNSSFFIAMLLILITLGIQDLRAQTLEIHGFYGYQLNGKAKLYDGEFIMQDAPNFGGKLAVGLSTTTFVEISYMRSDSEGYFKSYYSSVEPGETTQYSSNYITVGALQEVDLGKIRPYGTFGMGTVIWAPKDYSGTKWQFQFTLGAGFKIWLTDNIGLRAQGSMMLPLVYNGTGFGCGIGTGGAGCGGAVYTRITPFQGEFSGGIILRIGNN
jgi:opacity protein-like surface antigen